MVDNMEKRAERELRILKELRYRTVMSIAEIGAFLNVSQSTARRIGSLLHQSGKALRTIGGVRALPEQKKDIEYSYDVQATQNIEEKRCIGRYASTLVESGSVIFISGGTTTHQFVSFLAERIDSGELDKILVMTNSLDVVHILGDRKKVKIFLTGGVYLAKHRDVIGSICEQTIKEARFNQCFIGVDGLDLTGGLIALDPDIAAIDCMASERSDLVFVLADHTKFDKKSHISYGVLEAKHTIITDNGIDSEKLKLSISAKWKIISV
jgi:DeoR family fructose operon transcriptional repressor